MINTVKNKPLVSVIIPIYNAEKYIVKAVNSILLQSFKNFELILINDASTDKTFQIIHKLKKKDKRIKIINNKKNIQMAESLNLGIGQAKSKIIARMDQDDIAFIDRLKVQYDFLQVHPDVAIVGNDIIIIDKEETIIGMRTYPTTSDELKKIMFRYSPFAHPTVMFRKDAYQKIGGYDAAQYPCEDIDFWFRLGRKYKFGSIAKPLLKYRLTTNSSSHSNVLKTEIMGFKIKINALKSYDYKPSIYDILYNIMQFSTAWFMPAGIRIRLYNLLRSKKII